MSINEIKARFLHEYIKSSNLEAVRREIAAGLRGPAGPPPDFRVHMIAALETVAADIWADGYAACYARQLQSDRWPYPEEDEQAEKEYAEACGRNAAARAPNPYREQED